MSWKNLQSFRLTLFVLVSGLLLTACDDWIPDINFPSSSGAYFGKIIDDNTLEPISDAEIMCNNQTYQSNIEGYFEIKTSPEDYEVTIKVSKKGYEDFVQTVTIKGEEALELNISLTPTEKSL